MTLSSSVMSSFRVAAWPLFSMAYLRIAGPVLSTTIGSLIRLPVSFVATVLLRSSPAVTRIS